MKQLFSWNLQVLMAMRGIRTATDLASRLAVHGYKVNPGNAARFVRERPDRLNWDMLQALVTVLDCSLDALFGYSPPTVGCSTVPVSQVVAGSPEEHADAVDMCSAALLETPAALNPECVVSGGAASRKRVGRSSEAPRKAALPDTPTF